MVKSFNVYIEEAIKIVDIDQRYHEAESFYLRLFNLLYEYENLINLNFKKKNFPGIDLYESNLKLGIQITALTPKNINNVSSKVTNTIERFMNSKEFEKYPTNKFVIFFTKDSKYIEDYKKESNLKLLEDKHKIKIKLRTSSSLCEKYDSIISKSKRNHLHEFIRAEMESDFRGSYSLNYVSHIDNNLKNNSLFFTEEETYWKEDIGLQISNSNKELLILGAPCSGKTELSKSLIEQVDRIYKVYYLNFIMSESTIELTGVMADLLQISFNYSILIIDDVHLNIDLLNRIRNRLKSYDWLNVIYISRPTNEVRSCLKDVAKYYIDNKANQAQKVLGIIRVWKENQELNLSWDIGDDEYVVNQYRNNLVKLGLALSLWSEKGPGFKLSELKEEDILNNFYYDQNLSKVQSNVLFLSSYLGKFDLPLRIYREGRLEIFALQNIGLLRRIHNSDYYRYEHREFARAIYDSCSIQNSFDEKDVENWLEIYFNQQPNVQNLNLVQLIIGLHKGGAHSLPFILNNDVVISEIQKLKITNRNESRNPLIHIISSNLFSINKLNKKLYHSLIKNDLSNRPLLNYDRIDYEIYESIKDEEEFNSFIKINNNLENSRQTQITELAKSISKKKFAEGTVQRILNTYDFPTWYLKVMELHELSQLSMVLSELNKSNHSRVLLSGILEIIDLDKFIRNHKRLSCDKIGIALREFQSIDDTIGSGLAQQIWEEPVIKDQFEKSTRESNLSSCLKAISDIRFIDYSYSILLLQRLIEEEHIMNYLKNETSIGSLVLRVQELCKFERFIDTIYPLLYIYFNSNKFHQLVSECNNSHNLKLLRLLIDNSKYQLKNGITVETNILIDNKLKKFDSSQVEISTENIEAFILCHKFTKLEHYITSLKKSNKKQTTLAFKNVTPDVLFKASIKGPLAAYQIAEQLYKFRSWLFLNTTDNCDTLISIVLEKYLSYQVSNNSRFKQLPFEKFLSTFSYSLKINSEIAKKHLEKNFLNRMTKQHIGSNSLSIIFQMLRRITEFDNRYIDPVKSYLNDNMENFVKDITEQDLTKSIPGIIELSKSKLNEEALNLLKMGKNQLKLKIKNKSNQVTSIESIVRGLLVVDKAIDNRVSNELIASL